MLLVSMQAILDLKPTDIIMRLTTDVCVLNILGANYDYGMLHSFGTLQTCKHVAIVVV